MRTSTSPVGRPSVSRALSGGSPAWLVVTVGASVEPYVRLTTAPKSALACSTNADVTPAPPDEMRRSDRTRSAENPPAAIRVTKDGGRVGGAHGVMDGDGDGAQTPAGPVEQHGLVDIAQLPAHRVAPTHAARPQHSGHGGDLFGHRAARAAGQNGVERGHVPGAA